MDDTDTTSNTAVNNITENSDSALEDAEEISAADSNLNESTSDLYLESMHSSMQSLIIKGSIHSMESGSIITIASTDEKTIHVEQKEQDDQADQKDQGDQRDQGDQKDQEEQADQEKLGDQLDHGNQKDQKKAKMVKHEYICVILLTFLCMAIPFIWYHLERADKEVMLPGQTYNLATDVQSNDSCPFWHLLGDNYCDDEANIPECGYDLEDCCKIESDRSTTCIDCFCYIPGDKKVGLEGQFIKKCLSTGEYAIEWFKYFGDGKCDLGFNNQDHFFDIGDCCLENPTCMSSTFLSTAKDPFCDEDICIKSNLFCVKEELGDGICQGHNNGPYCDHDLGDCCLVTETSKTNCTCNCECFMDAFYPSDASGIAIPWIVG